MLRTAANMSSALHLGSQKRYGELIAQALQREYLITYNVQPSLRQTSVIRHEPPVGGREGARAA